MSIRVVKKERRNVENGRGRAAEMTTNVSRHVPELHAGKKTLLLGVIARNVNLTQSHLFWLCSQFQSHDLICSVSRFLNFFTQYTATVKRFHCTVTTNVFDDKN